jgi:GT2 family glycosyltransferase
LTTAARCEVRSGNQSKTLGSRRLDAPVAVTEIELAEGFKGLPSPDQNGSSRTVLALVRLHTQPIGTVVFNLGDDGLSADDMAQVVDQELGPEIAAHLKRDDMTSPDDASPGIAPPPCLRQRAAILAAAPSVSVIIATRERPDSLARCLDSVLSMQYPVVEVVVVDNAPSTSATADLIASTYEARGVRYVREDRRGLAAAHNRGVEVASGELLAFTDDDVVVDRHWLAAIATAFTMTDGVGAVTGLIMPGELGTAAQLAIERHGHFSKGFEPLTFDLGRNRPADRRFPLAVGRCGSGANMAFDAQCLRRLGGFHPALGTGTLAKGGDDLAAFFAVLTSGYRLVYQPGAVVRHWHRDTETALARQVYGYGVGLGAYLTHALATQPAIALPTALRAAWPNSVNEPRWSLDSPADLKRLARRGALIGPLAYAASRWRARAGLRPARG